MKYINNPVILFLVCWFSTHPPILAAEIRGLEGIYATPIPSEIRRNFNEYVYARENYPDFDDEHAIVDGAKFIHIYTKKFLVIGLAPNNHFGGVWAIIAVEGETRPAFQLWLYDIGGGEYELRSVDEVPGHFDKQFLEKCHTPIFSKYWL